MIRMLPGAVKKLVSRKESRSTLGKISVFLGLITGCPTQLGHSFKCFVDTHVMLLICSTVYGRRHSRNVMFPGTRCILNQGKTFESQKLA